MDAFIPKTVTEWSPTAERSARHSLLAEEPLSIRIEGRPYAVIMRTPGDERAHAAGFCLAEGLVDTREDISELACCEGNGSNVVTVTLSPSRRRRVDMLLDRRAFISQTSCGICGKEIVQDLYQRIQPLADTVAVEARQAQVWLETLSRHQPLRAETHAAHAAALFNAAGALLAAADDVGRHNALD